MRCAACDVVLTSSDLDFDKHQELCMECIGEIVSNLEDTNALRDEEE